MVKCWFALQSIKKLPRQRSRSLDNPGGPADCLQTHISWDRKEKEPAIYDSKWGFSSFKIQKRTDFLYINMIRDIEIVLWCCITSQFHKSNMVRLQHLIEVSRFIFDK